MQCANDCVMYCVCLVMCSANINSLVCLGDSESVCVGELVGKRVYVFCISRHEHKCKSISRTQVERAAHHRKKAGGLCRQELSAKQFTPPHI